jgi:hypothetical protein
MLVRRYWASDPFEHFLEMKRQSCAMVALKLGCVRIGYATQGGGLLGHQPFRNRRPRSSESKPTTIRCRDGVGQIFH